MSSSTLAEKTCTSQGLMSLSFYKDLCSKKTMNMASIFSKHCRRNAFFAKEQNRQATQCQSKTTEKGQAVPSSIEKKPSPLLKKGSLGNDVIYLQQSLANLGHNPGPIDGIFGTKTEQAVRFYQKVKGLLVDGIVGQNTWAVIESALAKLPPTHALLKKGSRGSETIYLQQSLFKLGFNNGAADGIFGDRTEQAVKSYQFAKGLAVDGIVGPLTWAALEKALAYQAKVLNKVLQAQTKDKRSLASKLFGFFTKN